MGRVRLERRYSPLVPSSPFTTFFQHLPFFLSPGAYDLSPLPPSLLYSICLLPQILPRCHLPASLRLRTLIRIRLPACRKMPPTSVWDRRARSPPSSWWEGPSSWWGNRELAGRREQIDQHMWLRTKHSLHLFRKTASFTQLWISPSSCDDLLEKDSYAHKVMASWVHHGLKIYHLEELAEEMSAEQTGSPTLVLLRPYGWKDPELVHPRLLTLLTLATCLQYYCRTLAAHQGLPEAFWYNSSSC